MNNVISAALPFGAGALAGYIKTGNLELSGGHAFGYNIGVGFLGYTFENHFNMGKIKSRSLAHIATGALIIWTGTVPYEIMIASAITNVVVHFCKGKPEEQREQIVAQNPQSTIPIFKEYLALNLQKTGELKLQLHEFELASELLKQALEIEPDHAPTKLNLASAYCSIGQYNLAEETIQPLIAHEDKKIAQQANDLLTKIQGPKSEESSEEEILETYEKSDSSEGPQFETNYEIGEAMMNYYQKRSNARQYSSTIGNIRDAMNQINVLKSTNRAWKDIALTDCLTPTQQDTYTQIKRHPDRASEFNTLLLTPDEQDEINGKRETHLEILEKTPARWALHCALAKELGIEV